MVNCSYCHKEIRREVFCSTSHKVMYHRGQSLRKVNKSSKLFTKGKQELTNRKLDLSKEFHPIPK